MRAYSKLLALTASLTLVIGILALPLPSASAQTSGGFGSTTVDQITALSNAKAYVNGVAAGVGTKYTDADSLTVVAGTGGFTSLSRTASGTTTTKTIYGSISSVSFQAIWIGDD